MPSRRGCYCAGKDRVDFLARMHRLRRRERRYRDLVGQTALLPQPACLVDELLQELGGNIPEWGRVPNATPSARSRSSTIDRGLVWTTARWRLPMLVPAGRTLKERSPPPVARPDNCRRLAPSATACASACTSCRSHCHRGLIATSPSPLPFGLGSDRGHLALSVTGDRHAMITADVEITEAGSSPQPWRLQRSIARPSAKPASAFGGARVVWANSPGGSRDAGVVLFLGMGAWVFMQVSGRLWRLWVWRFGSSVGCCDGVLAAYPTVSLLGAIG